uniref:Shugoshin N-terminal coiled-coil domain-containing protein n=1 Tax=Bionectria ochroleuca TaxID=29856 RepID=A0A8H7NDQ2_BIOOC
MARLNEPPVSTDSLETLRRKLLRQNRDLAKSNNVRALKIRELENDCACMLSENLQLRSRILELEKQVEDNDARRIADHALAIKAKLESQLTEWGDLIAGLGLEPPPSDTRPVFEGPLPPDDEQAALMVVSALLRDA